MEQEYKYMVVTRCFTFNHASYIVDAMNGFTMQETTFPVITLIVDDASTDCEPEVIKQYLTDHFQTPYRIEETEDYNLICANHNTNPNCTFVVFLLKYNHYSIKKAKFPYLAEWLDNAKYHALCEGDDYWIHPGKLQMQVDFMEAYPDYSMCFHNSLEKMESNQEKMNLFSDIVDADYDAITIFRFFLIPTASVLMKSEVLHLDYYKNMVGDVRMNVGDLPLWLSCYKIGKVRGLSNVMSVYRRHKGGLTYKPMSQSGLIASANRYLVFMEMCEGKIRDEAVGKYISFMVSAAFWKSFNLKVLVKCFVAYPVKTIVCIIEKISDRLF